MNEPNQDITPSVIAESGTAPDGIAVAPSLGPALASVDGAPPPDGDPARIVVLSALNVGVALLAVAAAEALVALIGFITNVSFYHTWSFGFTSPAGNHLGAWVIAIPIAGALIVGLMARYGSPAVRGHGIPEAMERVLLAESRIPVRVTFLKPLSAAVSIGTGGPFGAEGPIIATGGALGSLVGQLIHVSAEERKTLLAGGAAAGMAAIFGTPVAAVLLSIELLLFEYRPRSLIPVSLAAATAAGARIALHGSAPVFPMPPVATPGGVALAVYILLGALFGTIAANVTRALYAVEDAFARLPIHWMWWPALGAVVVGVVGLVAPRTLGVGYDNIIAVLGGSIAGWALAALVVFKLASWLIALGSGTSGGTLAPLFTVGGGLGALLGAGAARLAPGAGIDPHVAALVGMASIFAGASHAVLASVVFAFEATRQPVGLLPLLGGCAAAYLIALLHSPRSIMTEKLERRGTRVRVEYGVDHLQQVAVFRVASADPVVLQGDRTLEDLRRWLARREADSRHQGFPVVDGEGGLLGVVTRRDLLDDEHPPATRLRELIRRPPLVIAADASCREAADLMVRARVGRLVVVRREEPRHPAGMITRSDLLRAHESRLAAAAPAPPSFRFMRGVRRAG